MWLEKLNSLEVTLYTATELNERQKQVHRFEGAEVTVTHRIYPGRMSFFNITICGGPLSVRVILNQLIDELGPYLDCSETEEKVVAKWITDLDEDQLPRSRTEQNVGTFTVERLLKEYDADMVERYMTRHLLLALDIEDQILKKLLIRRCLSYIPPHRQAVVQEQIVAKLICLSAIV